jgi:hypothetical protein
MPSHLHQWTCVYVTYMCLQLNAFIGDFSTPFCNFTFPTAYRDPWYIIGGGTVRHSTHQQRTFEQFKVVRSLHGDCVTANCKISICPKRPAPTTRLEAVSLTLSVAPRPLDLFDSTLVRRFFSEQFTTVCALVPRSWMDRSIRSVWCTRCVSIWNLLQLFARTCVWIYSLRRSFIAFVTSSKKNIICLQLRIASSKREVGNRYGPS